MFPGLWTVRSLLYKRLIHKEEDTHPCGKVVRSLLYKRLIHKEEDTHPCGKVVRSLLYKRLIHFIASPFAALGKSQKSTL